MSIKSTSSYFTVKQQDNRFELPSNVHAVTTLRDGGFSIGNYGSFNLALHVDDDALTVPANRKKLRDELDLPAEPVWLEQVHSNKVVRLTADDHIAGAETVVPVADASVTSQRGVVCTVMTADCLPVFFCNKAGTEVGVAHAGWRGLHAGIISNTLDVMDAETDEIVVHLGPAIGPEVFEVGPEVRQAFIEINPKNASAFVKTPNNHYLCDIYLLAKNELNDSGVRNITGGQSCTFLDDRLFYSFRRQKNTGRMANLIWID